MEASTPLVQPPRWVWPVFAIPAFAYFVAMALDSEPARIAYGAIRREG